MRAEAPPAEALSSTQSTVEFQRDRPNGRPQANRPADDQRSVAAIIVDVLAEHGVDTVFGIPGGPIAPLNDALLDRPQIRSILTRHENTAVFAAAGYALTSGKVGVVVVTSGPGILNALTGIASAHCDGLPVLVLIGEVPRARQGRAALQDGSAHGLQIVSVLSSLTKHAVELTSPDRAATTIHDAIRTALDGRNGPVAVTLPLDVLTKPTDMPHIRLSPSSHAPIPFESLARVEAAIKRTRRGVILAGSGLRRDGASTHLLQLAERLDWPVMTTPKAKGVFPADHRLCLGVYGTGGHPSAHDYVDAGIDTLLALGTSLGDLATNAGGSALRPSEALIHVDIDARQFGRTYAPQIAVEAPAGEFCRALLARLTVRPVGPPRHVKTGCLDVTSDGDVGVNPQRAICSLQAALPEDTIYTIDAGDHYLYAAHYLRINRADCYIAMSGLGSMGSSLGGAIGAKLAAPNRTVAVIIGDGGLAMAAGDLATATAAKLDIIVFVMNNGCLGMVEQGNRAIYGRTPCYPIDPLDVTQLAQSLGAQATVVGTDDELGVLSSRIMDRHGVLPLVIDVRLDARARLPQNGRFTALGDDVGRAQSRLDLRRVANDNWT